MITKRCSRCKLDLELDCFTKHRGQPHDRSAYCKPCYRIRQKEWRETEAGVALTERTAEAHRLQAKQWGIDNSERKKQLNQEHYANNAQTYIDKAAKWVDDNRERYRQIHRQSEGKRRAMKVETSAGDVDYAVIAERDNWNCYLCQQHIEADLQWPNAGSPSWDHVLPLSKGGTHTTENIKLTHLSCNLRKGASVLEEVI